MSPPPVVDYEDFDETHLPSAFVTRTHVEILLFLLASLARTVRSISDTQQTLSVLPLNVHKSTQPPTPYQQRLAALPPPYRLSYTSQHPRPLSIHHRRTSPTVPMAPKSNPGEGKKTMRPSDHSPSPTSPPSLDNDALQHHALSNTRATDLVNTAAYREWRANNPHPIRTCNQLARLYNDAQAAGNMPNPGEVPWGSGHWEWLEPHDGVVAAEMGYSSHQQVERTRQAGRLPNNTNRATPADVGPNTVWVPVRDAWNPSRPSTRHGFYAFVAHGDRALARINLGGQDAYGLGDRADPTADEVFAVRRRQQGRMAADEDVLDPTDGIDLVWVPEGTPPAAAGSDGEPVVGIGNGQVDKETKLTHEPTNGEAGGEHDQTGDETAHYQSRLFDGRQVTVDRSVARLGQPEAHKRFIVSKRGKFAQWLGYAKMSWESKEDLNKLNKWREMTSERNFWPNKRKKAYIDYTNPQKKYLFDMLVKADGRRRLLGGAAEALKDFNDKFPNAQRSQTSVDAQLARMAEMWRDFNGVFQPGPGKKNKKRKESGDEEGSEGGDGDRKEGGDKKKKKRRRDGKK
ncbi:hypothetical protein LTR78_001140 [Recurvomyces mirabilis]|uniref:Uncharacterized protein n=1 Tax=Recurvomyces mirabilis TaxID=574656 RepID=A0AAE0WVQ3_9PEZI|nr:hypothetical protein LTR78_001140 [Recurvomyces mirabilis]KAK5161116.1 hypothetical protein LTS14_000912 [Recurvomyces mirabilis]